MTLRSSSKVIFVVTTASLAAAWVVWRRLWRLRVAHAFEARIRRRASAFRSPCVLDASPATAKSYPSGSLELIEDDLRAALGAKTAEALNEALHGPCGLRSAFELRRELISYKKACLCLFQDAQRLELSLHRQAMFFFRDHPSRTAFHLAPHWPEYSSAATALERARAVRVALHDVRDLSKAICALPRHPECAAAPPPPPQLCS